jgi:uncharacterized protein YjbJ (UPF0337 family)
MNRDRFEGVCKQFTGKVKEEWCRLTGDLPGVVAGKRDQRAGRIQERYGISKETVERQLEEFLIRNRDWNSLIVRRPVDSIHDAGSRG